MIKVRSLIKTRAGSPLSYQRNFSALPDYAQHDDVQEQVLGKKVLSFANMSVLFQSCSISGHWSVTLKILWVLLNFR